MPFPKKIKKDINLTHYRTLYPRRLELLDKINEHGTFLPKSILHADLDKGFLDFVKDDLKVVVEGKTIPTVDILVTTQNWTQFTQTWNFQDLDKNTSPPFITVVRQPEIKYGSNPATPTKNKSTGRLAAQVATLSRWWEEIPSRVRIPSGAPN